MTEKLLTGTLNKNQNKKQTKIAAAVSPNIKYILHHQLESTDLFVDFSKQKHFTYPFPAKFTLICRRSSNLSSKQSVVRCVDENSACYGSINFPLTYNGKVEMTIY